MELRGAMSLRIVLFYFAFSVSATSTFYNEMFLEPGVFEENIFIDHPTSSEALELYHHYLVEKSMYANSEIAVEVLSCSSKPLKCNFTLEWTVRQSDCDGVYRTVFTGSNTTVDSKLMDSIYFRPNCFLLEEEHTISFIQSEKVKQNPPLLCSGDTDDTHDKLNDLKGNNWDCSSRSKSKSPPCNKEPICFIPPEEKISTKPGDADAAAVNDGATENKNDAGSSKDQTQPNASSDQRKKRAAEGESDPQEAGEPNPEGANQNDGPDAGSKDQEGQAATTATPTAVNNTLLKNRVVHTNEKDGRFIFIIVLASKCSMNVLVRVRMKSPHGYLSATQYPFLPFYGIMCAMYSILGLIWIVLLFRQWRDLLRIQFWISVVILLGLIEKAAFVAEFERHNNTGSNSSAGIFFAEELSVLKRTMARMLVIVVSLGYGITRPRLGRDLNWLMGAGVMFFLLSSIEAYFKIFEPHKSNDLIALLPLSILDAVLCWWIFRSLVDTSRTLRLRRNLVKLWLYRHFTNALIFCVVAAVIFMVWSLKAHRMNKCVKKWNELWVDDAYWHILFFVILIVIMILFRPTANNQRYAYSVLSDAVEEDESKEPMMNDAFESVKMRNVHSTRTNNQPKEVDDLQWVEDNIPAAVADAALGAFDDSEEELITNVERNKME